MAGAKKGFSNLIGSDISPEAIKLCQILMSQTGVKMEINQDDCIYPKIRPKEVATILSVNWLYHLQDATMENFLATYRSCLKKNGKIVCDVVDAAYNQFADNQYHSDDLDLPPAKRRKTRYLTRYSFQEMEKISAENGFKILRYTRLHQSIPRTVYMLEMIN